MKKQPKIDFNNIELDLFYQIWKIEVDPPKHYKEKLLYEAYLTGCNKEQFFFNYVYIPF